MPCRARRVTTASAKASRATAPVVCIAPRAGYAFPRLSGTRLSSAPRAYGVVSRSTRAQRARCLRVEARVRRARAGPDEGFRGPPRSSHRGTIHPFRGSLGHLEPQKTRLFLEPATGSNPFCSSILCGTTPKPAAYRCLPLLGPSAGRFESVVEDGSMALGVVWIMWSKLRPNGPESALLASKVS